MREHPPGAGEAERFAACPSGGPKLPLPPRLAGATHEGGQDGQVVKGVRGLWFEAPHRYCSCFAS